MITEIDAPPAPPQEPPGRTRRRLDWRVGVVLLAMALSVPVYRALKTEAKAEATPSPALPIAVVPVRREDLANELVLQGEFRPFQEVDLHSKVAGFVEKVNVDIGDRVLAGQILAVLEIPELVDDLARARAVEQRSSEEVKRAESIFDDAHTAYTRLVAVSKAQPRLVAPQDLDAAHGKDLQAQSAVAAARQQVEVARAESSKLNTMAHYSRIVAPFSGVITKRYANPGELIPAGTASSTQVLPLVRLSQTELLRLDFPVSISHAAQVKVGDPVDVEVESLHRRFAAKISRFSGKIDTATRKMDVEVDVPNQDFSLLAGDYASIILKLDRRKNVLTLPIEAVARGKTTTVFVVNAGHFLEERPVKLGLETAAKVEILQGLRENDLVAIGGRSLLKPGQPVEPRLIPSENTP